MQATETAIAEVAKPLAIDVFTIDDPANVANWMTNVNAQVPLPGVTVTAAGVRVGSIELTAKSSHDDVLKATTAFGQRLLMVDAEVYELLRLWSKRLGDDDASLAKAGFPPVDQLGPRALPTQLKALMARVGRSVNADFTDPATAKWLATFARDPAQAARLAKPYAIQRFEWVDDITQTNAQEGNAKQLYAAIKSRDMVAVYKILSAPDSTTRPHFLRAVYEHVDLPHVCAEYLNDREIALVEAMLGIATVPTQRTTFVLKNGHNPGPNAYWAWQHDAKVLLDDLVDNDGALSVHIDGPLQQEFINTYAEFSNLIAQRAGAVATKAPQAEIDAIDARTIDLGAKLHFLTLAVSHDLSNAKDERNANLDKIAHDFRSWGVRGVAVAAAVLTANPATALEVVTFGDAVAATAVGTVAGTALGAGAEVTDMVRHSDFSLSRLKDKTIEHALTSFSAALSTSFQAYSISTTSTGATAMGARAHMAATNASTSGVSTVVNATTAAVRGDTRGAMQAIKNGPANMGAAALGGRVAGRAKLPAGAPAVAQVAVDVGVGMARQATVNAVTSQPVGKNVVAAGVLNAISQGVQGAWKASYKDK